VSKELLPEDNNSGNEADSESEKDTPATFACEPILAYLNDLQCNNPTGDNDEWVINENITFDYPESVDLFKFVDNDSLHMPLLLLSMTSTPVECREGSVFVVPPSKRSQSLIIFGRAQLRRSAVTYSSSDSEPPIFFYYAQSTHLMMRKMRYNLQHGKGLNFEKGRRDFLQNFMPKGKPANYYDKTHRGLRYVTSPTPTPFKSKDNESIPSHSASLSEWESDVSTGMLFKNLSINMTSINQLEQEEAIETFDAEPWAKQLDLQWKKRFEQRELPTEDRVIHVNLGRITLNPSL